MREGILRLTSLSILALTVVPSRLASAGFSTNLHLGAMTCRWDPGDDSKVATGTFSNKFHIYNQSTSGNLVIYCAIPTYSGNDGFGDTWGLNPGWVGYSWTNKTTVWLRDNSSTGDLSVQYYQYDVASTNYSVCSSVSTSGVPGPIPVHPNICTTVFDTLVLRVAIPPSGGTTGTQSGVDFIEVLNVS